MFGSGRELSSKIRFLINFDKLQASSNGSRLMGGISYHIRKSLGVLALMIFATKTITFASHSRQWAETEWRENSPLWAWEERWEESGELCWIKAKSVSNTIIYFSKIN